MVLIGGPILKAVLAFQDDLHIRLIGNVAVARSLQITQDRLLRS
jgi:hypothetical protein